MREALPSSRAQSSFNGRGKAWGAWAHRAGIAAIVLGAVAGGSLLEGCAVSESDVHRWEMTERGPYKLVAVITHDKYSWPLRIEAAMSLIRMPPRGGRRQGISYLVEKFKDEDGAEKDGALAQLAEEPRKKIVDGMAPELIRQMQVPPPGKNPDGTIAKDESIPYKDAAFAMLSHEPSLVSDPKTKDEFVASLQTWVQTDFENRIENSSQQYGIEQVMRFLGAPSVRVMPALFTESSTKIDKIASLIADLGDADTKQKASETLVALAKRIASDDWIKKQRPVVDDANKKAGQNVKPEQLEGQVRQYQDQQLTVVFGAMKRVGGRPIIEYGIGFGADTKNSETRRAAALAALEGKIDKTNQADIDRLFNVAKDDATPDSVRDVAFARLGELPKELIVPKLYTLFESKKWKVRWVAASLILRTMTTKDLADFMRRLPQSPATKMGMTEPISYGGLILKMEAPAGAPKPRDAMIGYLSGGFGQKLTALGSFYGGSKADLPKILPLETDSTPVPKCDKDDDCGWTCDVPKANSQETESKTITTVGEFAKFCVAPSLSGPSPK